ncbi:MAG: cytochrome c oxidase subunit 3, partial [Vicinamibacterales bacterium]
ERVGGSGWAKPPGYREDTGVNNVKLGVWLFLASEVMLFGGLFSAYFTLRAGAVSWAPLASHRPIAFLNTALLLGAGSVFAAAIKAARKRRADACRTWLVGATMLATIFLALKMLEYAHAASEGFWPRTSTQAGLYYLLTGVHALHVLAGIVVTLWLVSTSRRTWDRDPLRVVNRLEATALYWYFVDVVWLILVVLLYVV